MKRKGDIEDATSMNPLQRMFGVYMRLKRKQFGYSSEEFSGMLDLAPAYYRLMESGRTAISRGALFNFWETCKKHDVPIIFSRLAALFLGIQYVSDEMSNAKGDRDVCKRALTTLVERVMELRPLVERTSGYFDDVEDIREQKKFLNTVAYEELELFLLSGTYYTSRVEHLLDLSGLDPRSVKIVQQLHAQLKGRRFQV